LLDTAKIERGSFDVKKTKLEMAELISQTIRLFSLKADKLGVALKEERTGVPPPALMADGERIKQVLSNLVSNALKYTRPGGRITVSMETIDGSRLASLSGRADAGLSYALVCVTDTGAGIPAGDQDRIFGKFEQVKNSGYPVKGAKGVGLGLYIAKSIVLAHDGIIWVESAEGKGSRFYFALPA
ncbi:MAG: HAMP domain-containing sensor histidine kinase, partial [Elusimicrobiota bacterium]